MASELLKTKALSARIKEPKVRDFDFGLNLTSIESLIPDLPQPKPQELLDIQEQNRKGRLLDSLNKIGGGLEDSSLDFIRRDNFDKGGVAKVFAHLDSLSEGTEIDLNYIRKYIGDNNINASAENVFKQFDKINRKQIAGSGNETFTYSKEKRDQLTRLKNKLKIKKLTRYIPATKENLDKLDDLIKNTDLTVEKIGEKMGYENPKSFKLAPTTKNVLTKAYLKKYGSPPEGRFKVKILDPESKYVKDVINLKEQGVNTTQIANKFNKTRMTIVNVFRKMGREDLIDDVNEKKTGSAKKTVKKNRRANIAEGEKFASSTDKAFNKKEEARVKEINKYVKQNIDKFTNNKKVVNLINLKLDGKGNIISKNKTPEEIKKSINRDRFFERDHISSVAKRKRNMQFPVNFQMSPYNINQGFFIAAESYVNRPDADPEKIKKISNVLDNYKLRLSTNKGIIGSKEIPASQIIDNNLKALDINPNIGKEQYLNQVKKVIASVSPNKNCQGKFNEGGPVNIDKCFYEGKKAINDGKIAKGAQSRNFAKFANKAMEIGKQSGRGLRTIAKFGVLPEMVIIGADTAIRAGMGDTFNEAFLRASDIYRTDDAYEQADASEINRRMNSNDGELILNLRKFNNERAKLSSLEQQKEADLALEGDDFAETNSGMTAEEIENFYNPKIQEQENNLFNASISDAEERAGLAKDTEFADKKGVDYKKSIVGGFLDTLAEKPGLKQALDLFNTGTVQQPDVSAQAIDNYAPDAFKKTIQKYGPKVTLDVIKKFEAEQEYPEGAVRNKNLQDEERRLLFEAAKNDPALAELYFGPSMTFAGNPIDQTDLQDEMNLDRGIYSQGGRIGYSNGSEGTALAIEESLEAFQRYLKAGGKLGYKDFIALGNEGVSKFFNSGGRVGFADGPKNPGRRTFMKLAAGIASIPILGKFFKPAVPLVKKLANSNTVMPDWFPNFVDKFVGRSIGKKIDADLMEYTNPDLPNIKLTRNDDGSILVEGKNEYNEAYNISYEPPGYELIDETTGKAVKTKGEFEAVEGRHVALGPEDYDTDPFYADDLDELFTSDIAEMEKYTTGNVTKTVKDAFGTETGLKKGKYDVDMAQGQAENRADILRDEGLDEID